MMGSFEVAPLSDDAVEVAPVDAAEVRRLDALAVPLAFFALLPAFFALLPARADLLPEALARFVAPEPLER
jgi:hypothetical protein